MQANPESPARFAGLGRHLVTPWKVVIAGPPNVGKSSLINALAGFQRSVVAPIPGTTRDVVRVQVSFDGWPVELCDTAGMRTGADELETEGIDRARVEYYRADLRIWVLDLAADLQQWPDLDPAPEIVVGNKVDAAGSVTVRSGLISVSATRGDGLAELIAAIVHKLVPIAPPPGAGIPFTPALCDAIESSGTTGRLDSPR